MVAPPSGHEIKIVVVVVVVCCPKGAVCFLRWNVIEDFDPCVNRSFTHFHINKGPSDRRGNSYPILRHGTQSYRKER